MVIRERALWGKDNLVPQGVADPLVGVAIHSSV